MRPRIETSMTVYNDVTNNNKYNSFIALLHVIHDLSRSRVNWIV